MVPISRPLVPKIEVSVSIKNNPQLAAEHVPLSAQMPANP
jgi:hypothetical protein